MGAIDSCMYCTEITRELIYIVVCENRWLAVHEKLCYMCSTGVCTGASVGTFSKKLEFGLVSSGGK